MQNGNTPQTPAPMEQPAERQPAARKPKVGPVVAIAVAIVLVVAVGAGAAVLFALRGTADVLIGKVPQDSFVYATAYLDPAAQQKVNMVNLLRKFPALQEEEVGKQFNDLMDQGLQSFGLRFEQDVKPWVGSQVGVVVRVPKAGAGFALLVDTSDAGAAEDALAKLRDGSQGATWRDVDYKGMTISVGTPTYALVGSTLVLSDNEAMIKSIVDADAGDVPSLGALDDYTTTVETLPEERLGLLYVNMPEITRTIEQSLPADPPSAQARQQLEAIRGIAVTFAAESDGFALETTVATDPAKLDPDQRAAFEVAPHKNATLVWTPDDALGLVTQTGLDKQATGLIDQLEQQDLSSGQLIDELGLRDAAGALAGDAGIEVSPDGGLYPGGALLLASKDDAQMQEFLDGVTDLATQAMADMEPGADGKLPHGFGTDTESYKGVTITKVPLSEPDLVEAGIEPSFAVSDGMAMLATSPFQVKHLIDAHGGATIETSPDFRAALAHAQLSNNGMFYANVAGIVDAVRKAVPPEELTSFDSDVAPNIEPIKAVVATVSTSASRTTAEFFVLIT